MAVQNAIANILDDDIDDDINFIGLLNQHQIMAGPLERQPMNYLFLQGEDFRRRFRAQRFVLKWVKINSIEKNTPLSKKKCFNSL